MDSSLSIISSLHPQPGLNVLIGPNGSGKTNIISFFEFLGTLMERSVSSAVSAAGGAGAVFSKVGAEQYADRIAATIRGNIRLRKNKFMYYEYRFAICMRDAERTIAFESQSLKVKIRTVRTTNLHSPPTLAFDLDIEQSTSESTSAVVHAFDVSKLGSHVYSRVTTARGKTIAAKEMLSAIMAHPPVHEHSLVPRLRFILDEWEGVLSDLRGGQVFNISPSQAREPEDSATDPGIKRDGSGLYATLYALSRRQVVRPRRGAIGFGPPRARAPRVSIEDVLKYLRLANESIQDLRVINDPFDNKLQVKVTIGAGGEQGAVLPLAAMSDGTVKWIALVTAILTNNSFVSIEEPENYLHPWMQAETISLMRASLDPEQFILMSTHSETILNNLVPEEVVVVSYRDGASFGRRVTNVAELMSEIQATGFGLGHYYLAGSLEDA
ncbi:MAG: ATP-binding protein [bacterium]|nr:ATP-binding protein [bacterium]